MRQLTVEELMNGYGSAIEFEDFIFDALRASGQFVNVESRRFDWDFGLDGIVTRKTEAGDHELIFIELKYAQHDRRVTLNRFAEAILRYQQLTKIKDYEGAKLAIVTNSSLTLEAQKACEEFGVEVWDKDKLFEYLGRELVN